MAWQRWIAYSFSKKLFLYAVLLYFFSQGCHIHRTERVCWYVYLLFLITLNTLNLTQLYVCTHVCMCQREDLYFSYLFRNRKSCSDQRVAAHLPGGHIGLCLPFLPCSSYDNHPYVSYLIFYTTRVLEWHGKDGQHTHLVKSYFFMLFFSNFFLRGVTYIGNFSFTGSFPDFLLVVLDRLSVLLFITLFVCMYVYLYLFINKTLSV